MQRTWTLPFGAAVAWISNQIRCCSLQSFAQLKFSGRLPARSPRIRAPHVRIPWPEITSMRNRLIHGYFDIDVDIVWNTASIELPALLADLRRIWR